LHLLLDGASLSIAVEWRRRNEINTNWPTGELHTLTHHHPLPRCRRQVDDLRARRAGARFR